MRLSYQADRTRAESRTEFVPVCCRPVNAIPIWSLFLFAVDLSTRFLLSVLEAASWYRLSSGYTGIFISAQHYNAHSHSDLGVCTCACVFQTRVCLVSYALCELSWVPRQTATVRTWVPAKGTDSVSRWKKLGNRPAQTTTTKTHSVVMQTHSWSEQKTQLDRAISFSPKEHIRAVKCHFKSSQVDIL